MLVTHVFVAGDQYLDSDAVFGVKNSLIREFTHHAPGTMPDGAEVAVPWRHAHATISGLSLCRTAECQFSFLAP